MWALMIAAFCAGLFAGAAIYINAVEHPARVSCGNDVALREFAPSYRRATVMQASLAVIGCVAGLESAWVSRDAWVGVGALLLGAVVPFTLVVILPTNSQLLEPSLDLEGDADVRARLVARQQHVHEPALHAIDSTTGPCRAHKARRDLRRRP